MEWWRFYIGHYITKDLKMEYLHTDSGLEKAAHTKLCFKKINKLIIL